MIYVLKRCVNKQENVEFYTGMIIMIEESEVDWKAEYGQINLAHVTKKTKYTKRKNNKRHA